MERTGFVPNTCDGDPLAKVLAGGGVLPTVRPISGTYFGRGGGG